VRLLALPIALVFGWALGGSPQTSRGDVTLELGTLVKRTLDPNDSHTYGVQLEVGEFFSVSILQRDASFRMRLEDSNGAKLIELDEPRLVWIAAAADRVRIRIEGPPRRSEAVHYSILLTDRRSATAADRLRLDAQAQTLRGLSLESGSPDQRKEALACYEEAQARSHEAADGAGEVLALLHAADVSHFLGDTQRALDASFAAEKLAHELDDADLDAEALMYASRSLSGQGRRVEAMELTARATALYQRAGDRLGEHVAMQGMASDYGQFGDYGRAVALLEKVLSFARETGNREGQAFVLYGLGNAYREIGDLPRALDYERQAVAIAGTVGRPSVEATILVGLGTAQTHARMFTDALDTDQRALGLFRDTGNFWQAAIVERNIGSIYERLADFERARDWTSRSLPGLRAAGDVESEAQSLSQLANAEWHLGQPEVARDRAATALDMFESIRARLPDYSLRMSFLSVKHRTYELAVDILVDLDRGHPGQGFDREALRVSERAKARGLLDTLTEAGVDLREGVDPSLLQREAAAQAALKQAAERQVRLLASMPTREQVTQAEQQVSRLVDDLRDARAAIRAASPKLQRMAPARPIAADEIQASLNADTALVEYSLGEMVSHAWIVTPSAVQMVNLPGRADIENASRRAYAAMSRSVSSPPSERASSPGDVAALSRMILEPLASRLTVDRLVIVTDGVLQYIPFGALTLGGRPLVASRAVSYLPSASTLFYTRQLASQRERAPKLAAVFADPVYTRDDERVAARTKGSAGMLQPRAPASAQPRAGFERSAEESGLTAFDRLYATRAEAAAIRTLAGGRGVMQALGFDASRATAMSPALADYRIVHFATHGLLNSRHPELSGLLLSLVDRSGRPQNGFLQAHEIYDLRLNADVVVLSSCQTALGPEIRGEGLIGLTRGFFHAGARTVVASLWRVPDAATAVLMRHFYEGLLVENLPPAQALRAAQIALREIPRWSAPYYWAGFVAQGE